MNGESPNSKGSHGTGTAKTIDRTIRLADLKGRPGHLPGQSATPAIKTGKTVFLMPSRPAPESVAVDWPSTSVAGKVAAPPPPARKAAPAAVPISAPTPKAPTQASTTTTQPPHALGTPSATTAIGKKSKVRNISAEPVERPEVQPGTTLTDATLPLAVGQLFELNNYSVVYGNKINGSEVDIIATPKGDPFGTTVYIEVTIQYVDVIKYGKDLTKFVLVREKNKQCTCICVSTKGFTADVRERATEARILVKTYQELFAQFEKFTPYVDKILNRHDISALVGSYQEPSFRDTTGDNPAVQWLNNWKHAGESTSNWLIILGEYGTGKTALTLKMQHEWLSHYRMSASNPIPIRIELKNFSRQFDSKSLLHHFLDTNSLAHISIDFLLYLIRNRRVILLLDGYDEMAQFLNARERRACLAALAELAGEGAKGILTSRPNYFTETEELHVFDALYTSLEQNDYFVGQVDKLFLAQERSIDKLLERYVINKNERYLRDLTPEQTRALVRRRLAGNSEGERIVLRILDKVFREESDGTKQSLAGKPVIISYLLELVDVLVSDSTDTAAAGLNEWQIYKLVVDRLMLRDLQRSPTMHIDDRRVALQKLAVTLSGKSLAGANEAIFFTIIDDLFRSDLRRLSPEEQRSRRDQLFQDLRSSATLTRSETATPSVWHFSHNSLREFLVAEAAVAALHLKEPIEIAFPISGAMRSFVAALPKELAKSYFNALTDLWPKRSVYHVGGAFLLAFDLLKTLPGGLRASIAQLNKSSEGRFDLSGIAIKDLEFNAIDVGETAEFICTDSVLTEITFRGLDMRASNFKGATFDRCSFIDCTLTGSNFQSTLIFECNFNRVEIADCDFRELDIDSNIIAATSHGDPIVLSGRSTIGYLRYHGAHTDDVPSFYELQHDPRFSIVLKICENIAEQHKSQLRGLTQRGAAQADPPFARSLIESLKRADLIVVDQNDLVLPTPEGRKQLTRMISYAELPEAIEQLLRT